MSEGVVQHRQHVGRGDDAGVVTPGSDQQPVVDLKRKKITVQLCILNLPIIIT